MAIKLEGGGGIALMAWPLVEELFFAIFTICPLFATFQSKKGHIVKF